MKKYFIVLFFLTLTQCSEKDIEPASYLESFDEFKYFNEEALSGSYQNLYGLWKIYSIYGGWSGEVEPDFTYLEIKPFGIYGLVRNNTLFEYGKISCDTFDTKPHFPGFQIKLEPDYLADKYPSFRLNNYFDLVQPDTLFVYDGIIDGITYSFKRIR